MTVEALSYWICAAGYLLLTAMLAWRWRGERVAGLLMLACALTTAWAVASAAAYQLPGGGERSAMIAELLRDAAWLGFLLALLRQWRGGDARGGTLSVLLLAGGFAAAVALDLLVPPISPAIAAVAASNLPFFIRLIAAILALVLIENLYRNAPADHRWSIKFLVLALGGVFAYDFFLYSSAALLRFRDPDLDAARGLVNVLVVPLIAVSAARGSSWGLRIHVSRQIAFYSATLLFGGAYLILVSAAGYYVRVAGGSWGGVLRLSFLFAAAGLLAVVVLSGRARSYVRGFVSRHFYSYKYDYREEWLRFIRTLAVDDGDSPLEQRVIRAVADILDSPDGLLWLRRSGGFELAAHWNRPPVAASEPVDGPFAEWLRRNEAVLDLKSPGEAPIPGWLEGQRRGWLVLPLLHRSQLAGFMVLGEARAPRPLDQEDRNLLLTAGRQAASYLAESMALSELLQAKEFESFNRRTTFLVHDLKNLLSQLSLLAANAQRHRGNPEFLDDMVATVESSAGKMRQLLVQLRPDPAGPAAGAAEARAIDVPAVLQQLLRSPRLSRVALTVEPSTAAPSVNADPERFAAVLRNLLENAVDSAPEKPVLATVTRRDSQVLVEIKDNGPGMDPAFIRDQLFSPFRTTKGEGYGIGAFESREFARQAGGRLEVDSSPGRGTAMRLILPAADTGAVQSKAPVQGGRQS